MSEQALVQAMLDKSGTVVLDRWYDVESPLTIPSNTRFMGYGNCGLNFLYPKGVVGKDFYIGNKLRRNSDPGDVNISVEGVKFRGPNPVDPLGMTVSGECSGFNFRKVTGLTIKHCDVSDIPLIGMVFGGCNRIDCSSNHVEGTGRDGINAYALIDSNQTCPLIYATFRDNFLAQLGDDGIAVYSCTAAPATNLKIQPTSISILGNHIRIRETAHPLSQGRGIAACGIGGEIIGNTVENTPATGIICYQQHPQTFTTSDILIANNVIKNAGVYQGDLKRNGDGILIKDKTNWFIVSGNVIKNSREFSLNVVDSQDGLLYGNLYDGKIRRAICRDVLLIEQTWKSGT